MTTTMNNPHLESIVVDENATVEQKIDCLKLLNVVIKNLVDPQKCIDPKYRHLKTSNEKVATKLLRFPRAVDFLISVGFSPLYSTADLQIPSDHTVNVHAMQTALLQVTYALAKVAPPSSSSSSLSTTATSSEQHSSHGHHNQNQKPIIKERLSEKQKARLLLAKKEADEKKLERLYREKNLKALKQDEHVRRNDPNWKSGVSSACAKTGSSISTFRDKYGEN